MISHWSHGIVLVGVAPVTVDPLTNRLRGLANIPSIVAIMSAAYEVYIMGGLAGEFTSDVMYRIVSTGDGGEKKTCPIMLSMIEKVLHPRVDPQLLTEFS